MNGSSSLGYPFASGGGVAAAVSGAVLRSVALPWTLALGWLSWCAGMLLRALTALGAPPLGYLPQTKVCTRGRCSADLGAPETVALLTQCAAPRRRCPAWSSVAKPRGCTRCRAACLQHGAAGVYQHAPNAPPRWSPHCACSFKSSTASSTTCTRGRTSSGGQ